MARPNRQCLYDALQAAEREWREYKATGYGSADERGFVGSAWYEREARQAYRVHERELFARVEAARKAWLDSWAVPG